MAKKGKKKAKKDTAGTDAVGAVRTAVERTFQATAEGAQSTRTRAQDLVDEVAGAAGRVREMIEDIRVLEDLKREVEALARRVAALEGSGSKPAARGRAASSGSGTRSRSASSGTRKTAAASGGRKTSAASGGRKTAASSGTRKTAAASGGRKTSAASGTRKTASTRSTGTRKTTRSSTAKKST